MPESISQVASAKTQDSSPSGSALPLYKLLWFIYIVLLMYDLYWGKSGLGRLYGPSIAIEPLAPKAIYSLLVAAVAGGLAYCRGLLGKSKPHRQYLIFAAAAALFTLARLAMPGQFWDKFLSIPGAWAVVVLLHLFFYSPLIGLARLVPGFDSRILYGNYDPLSALVIVLFYVGISVCGYKMGVKAHIRAAEYGGQQPDVDLAQCNPTPPNVADDALLPSPRQKLSRRLHKWIPLLLCALSVLFLVLWVAEMQDKSEFALLIRYTSEDVQEGFSTYESTGDERDYWLAVAHFKAFQQVYVLYCEKAGRPESGAQCSEIYEALSRDPDRAKPHLEKLASQIYACGHSVGSDRDYPRMAELHILFTQ